MDNENHLNRQGESQKVGKVSGVGIVNTWQLKRGYMNINTVLLQQFENFKRSLCKN